MRNAGSPILGEKSKKLPTAGFIRDSQGFLRMSRKSLANEKVSATGGVDIRRSSNKPVIIEQIPGAVMGSRDISYDDSSHYREEDNQAQYARDIILEGSPEDGGGYHRN
jgi:hypothetical protein